MSPQGVAKFPVGAGGIGFDRLYRSTALIKLRRISQAFPLSLAAGRSGGRDKGETEIPPNSVLSWAHSKHRAQPAGNQTQKSKLGPCTR